MLPSNMLENVVKDVSGGGGELSLGGAKPLSSQRLQVGQPGHPDCDRPSRILHRLDQNDIADDEVNNKEGIAIADDARKRQAGEGIRSGSIDKG